MARSLKTYTAEIDGLNDWIVAAPNQAEALEAFGLHQNLFSQGLAGVTKDAALIKAASASPGVPLKRPKGGKGRFTSGPADTDWSGALKAAENAAPKGKAPSRAKLDEARAELAAIEDAADKELAPLEAAVQAARTKLDSARARLEARRAKAEAAVAAAQAAYRSAGT